MNNYNYHPPQAILEFDGITVYRHSILYYIDKIQSLPQYAFNKINHAGWEIISKFKRTGKTPVEAEYLAELIEILYNIKDDPTFDFGVSIFGSPNKVTFHPNRVNDHIDIVDEIQIINCNELHLGTIWKESCIDGTILDLFSGLKDRYFVFIGMPHLREVGELLRFNGYIEHFGVIEVNPPSGLTIVDERRRCIPDGAEIRGHILNRVLRVPKQTVCILQCGELLSTWLTHMLRLTRTDLAILDLGRSLDCFCNEGDTQDWVKDHQKELEQNIRHYVPRI